MNMSPWSRVLLLALVSAPAFAQTSSDSAAADSVYTEEQVDKPATEVRESVHLFYPTKQRETGVEGCVIAQYVVNADGRADMSTFKTLRVNHAAFAFEVRRAVAKMRFEPAQLRGLKVKQLFVRPFMFTLTDRGRPSAMTLRTRKACQR